MMKIDISPEANQLVVALLRTGDSKDDSLDARHALADRIEALSAQVEAAERQKLQFLNRIEKILLTLYEAEQILSMGPQTFRTAMNA